MFIRERGLKFFAPSVYWKGRLKDLQISLHQHQHEAEFQLLPDLCSQDKLSLDVGADAGSYAICMAQYSKGCIAFEPRPDQASELMLMARHGALPITVEAIALSDSSGTAKMRILDKDRGRSTIEQANNLIDPDGSSVSQLLVQTRTLDSYRLENVGLIKIDVEGHEMSVLAGATETLTRCSPSAIIEAENRHRPNIVKDVFRFMESLDYTGYFFLDELLTPISQFDAELHQNPANIGSWNSSWARYGVYINNFVFLPPDRRELTFSRI